MMKETIYQRLIELTNGKTTSYMLRKFTTSRSSKAVIRSYSKLYDIAADEVSKNTEEFTSLHDFFTRKLKAGARPIAQESHLITSPVDAKIESFGDINIGTTLSVKNKWYSIADMLGKDELATRYTGGKFIVFYLSPADYHRIHSPINAKVDQQYVLGGKSYPVNQMGLAYGKKPISHNYRMISELQAEGGQRISFIKVGAMFVNSIVLTNTTDVWQKGEEVGYFAFGSTVVMLFEKDFVEFTNLVQQGMHIQVGQAFAQIM